MMNLKSDLTAFLLALTLMLGLAAMSMAAPSANETKPEISPMAAHHRVIVKQRALQFSHPSAINLEKFVKSGKTEKAETKVEKPDPDR